MSKHVSSIKELDSPALPSLPWLLTREIQSTLNACIRGLIALSDLTDAHLAPPGGANPLLISGRVDRASAAEAVDSGSIPG